jgi:transcription antitermination protein NusB
LRIKTMQALYAYFKHSGDSSLKKSEQELQFSIGKAFDLYHYLILLLIDLANYAESRIELSKLKRIPTKEDLSPNTKFIDNEIIKQIRINNQLVNYIANQKLSWVNYPELIRGIYSTMIECIDYKDYMNSGEHSYEDDRNFICNLYKNVISQYEPLYQGLEEQSIYWNDEPEFILGIIMKTFKKFKKADGNNNLLLPLYKSDDDREYPKILLRKVILNHKEYLDLIEKFSKNWDVERIAFIDTLLMQMAIAEVIEFSSIPVKVTLNEYLELAKYYSTPKSSVFLNGILDKIFSQLKEQKLIHKTGRGLIGEV